MRLLFTTFLALMSLALFSQSPEKINYQSIVRDLAGNVIQNQPISLRMSILSDSINGTIVYQETFQPTTNNFGLVNIKIGEGTPVIATMSSVDWSNGPFFLESAVDVTGGTNYIVVSTSQFMSVPYALYASESPLDTTQVQNIVNQQTSNFLDSTSIQNMIDSSVLNIDSTLIASWGYIDSNSIMILINNNSLDSTTIQNMIDNSIVNIDSSTLASWGYLDSSTIQILINNSTIDSSSVANWGYLDSTTIQNIITQQTNNYLDSASVQNMIDNSVINIDSSTVASWGYIDSNSIMILINNNSLDSAAIQNMINSSITNVDSSTVASWGYLDSSSILALISNSNIDSSSVASWGYLDSVSIQNMINNSSVNVDSTMIANFGFVAGPHTIDTDTQIDSTGIANYGFVTSSQVLDSSSVQNMINNSSSNVDSSTVSNWGYVDSSTVINLINQSGYLDSLTIQGMIDSAFNSSSFNGNFSFGDYVDLNLTFTAGGSVSFSDTINISEDCFLILKGNFNAPNTNIIEYYFNNNTEVFYIDDNPVNNFFIFPLKRGSSFRIGKDPSNGTNFPIVKLLYLSSSASSGSNSTIDSTSISNMGFVDSMTVVNMINSGGGVNDLRFPDGFSGLSPVIDFSGIIGGNNTTSTSSYTVPQGKNLYITNLYNTNNSTIKISGKTIFALNSSNDGSSVDAENNELYNPLIVPSGETISGFVNFSGFLVNTSPNVQPICVSADYQVPVGKKLVILNVCSNPGKGWLFLNGLTYNSLLYGHYNTVNLNSTGGSPEFVKQPIIIDENTVIEKYAAFNNDVNINGYLVDSDFFSSSGGSSGSGSNSTIDSTTVANWGFSTDTDTQIDSTGIANLGFVAGPHTIDTDTQIDSAGIAAMGYLDSVSIRNMIDSMVAQSVSSSSGPSLSFPEGITGIPFSIYLTSNQSYTVPSGKNLYILNTYNGGNGWLATSISGFNENLIGTYTGDRTHSSPIIISEGESITAVSSPYTVNGFLVDKNPSIIIKNIRLYGTNNSYTVPIGKNLYILNTYNGGNGFLSTTISGSLEYLIGTYTGDRTHSSPIIISEGESISAISSEYIVNGYLADINYFSPSSNSGSGSNSTIDSTTISNMGFVDSMTVVNMINSNGGGSGGFNFIDPIFLFYYGNPGNPYNSYSGLNSVYYSIAPGWQPSNNPNYSTPHSSVYLNSDTLSINIDSIVENHYDNFIITCEIEYSNSYGSNSSPNVRLFVIDDNLNDNIPIASLKEGTINAASQGNNSKHFQCVLPNSSSGIIKLGYSISGTAKINIVINGYINSISSPSGSNSTIDSTTVANWGFSTDTDTQIDSTGIANLGYVAGPHTIDTDTQIDSAGIAAMGYVAGPHTIDTDTQIDSAGIASHGFLDSVRIMELINQNGTKSTKTFGWPQGYGGDLVSFNFNQSDTTFIVPSDKNYYITSVYNTQQVQFSAPDVRINGLSYWGPFNLGYDNLTMPLILHPNDSIYVKDYQSMSFLVLAFDTSSAVKMITHNFNISPTFTVPNGKLFVYQKNTPVNINNIPINQNTPSISKGGDVITPTNTPSGNWDWISGYLVDEDYFKTDSGTSSGSGSGSSSGSGSNANTLIYTTNGF